MTVMNLFLAFTLALLVSTLVLAALVRLAPRAGLASPAAATGAAARGQA